MESESELESESRRPKKPKMQKWERQGLLSSMRQIRSPSSSMLVESSQNVRQVYNISEYDQEFQTLQPDQLRGFQDMTCSLTTSTTKSQRQASTHYGSMSSVRSHSGQVGGLSGHRLNINHFTQPIRSESGVEEICASFPDPIGPSLPRPGQHSRHRSSHFNCIFIICSSCTSHSSYRSASQWEWWRDQDQRSEDDHVRHSQNCVNITFFVVDDGVNPIIGLDALHQTKMNFIAKRISNKKRHRAALHYFKSHYSSGLVTQGHIKSSILQWEDPEHTMFDSQVKLTNQITAEIDFACAIQ